MGNEGISRHLGPIQCLCSISLRSYNSELPLLSRFVLPGRQDLALTDLAHQPRCSED